MFDLLGLNMLGNHEQRKVANFKKGEIVVDTCRVTDSNKPYETGISHPRYNNGKWVIVELYDTEKEAKIGHDKWVKTILAKKLPISLIDVSTSAIVKLIGTVSPDNKWRTHKNG